MTSSLGCSHIAWIVAPKIACLWPNKITVRNREESSVVNCVFDIVTQILGYWVQSKCDKWLHTLYPYNCINASNFCLSLVTYQRSIVKQSISHPGKERKDGVFEAHLPEWIVNRMISVTNQPWWMWQRGEMHTIGWVWSQKRFIITKWNNNIT